MGVITYMLSGPSNASVRRRRIRNRKINKAIDANIKMQKKIQRENLRAARARRIEQERRSTATERPVRGFAAWKKSITDELR